MVKVFCALLVKLSDSDSRKALTEGLTVKGKELARRVTNPIDRQTAVWLGC